MSYHDSLRAVMWENEAVQLLEQRLLPHQHTFMTINTVKGMEEAIRDMVVRGAPAIGIAAAYGVVFAAKEAYQAAGDNWREAITPLIAALEASRPTAVNLMWALARMRALFPHLTGNPVEALLEEAKKIQAEDIAANYKMGELGAALLPEHCRILTHCNAGSIATGGYGTALGVVRSAQTAGKVAKVYADETRPWLQGARLTAWELLQDNIPVTLLADCAAASLMQKGEVDWVIVGSDRIAANGDVANKIGTYNLAVLARYHGVKMMVVAPTSTIDMQCHAGSDIKIEQRTKKEVWELAGQRVAAEGADAINPVFDVTPAELVDVIVTEKGIVKQPTHEKMLDLMSAQEATI